MAAEMVQSAILTPLIEPTWARWLVILCAYLITMANSTQVVVMFLPTKPKAEDADDAVEQSRRSIGNVIGKCENIIIVTFVLAGQETGLALIFAAKALARKKEIESDPGYFLGGTLINFVWSLMIAFIARVLIAGL